MADFSFLTALPLISNLFGAQQQMNFQREENKENWRRQELSNQINRDWLLRNLNTQREWALNDRDFANRFNSPLQQMVRFQQAGLNPHLIYGNVSNQPSANVRSSDMGQPYHKPADYSIEGDLRAASLIAGSGNSVIQSMQAAKQLELQEKAIESQNSLRDAQALKTLTEADLKDFDVKFKNEFRDTLVEILQSQKSNLQFDAAIKNAKLYSMPDLEQAQKMIQQGLDIKDAEIARINELTKLAIQQGKLNQFDIEYMQKVKAIQGSSQAAGIIIDILKMILNKK